MKTLKQLGIFLMTVSAFGIGLWKYIELIDARKKVFDNTDFAVPAFWIFLGIVCAIWLWAQKRGRK